MPIQKIDFPASTPGGSPNGIEDWGKMINVLEALTLDINKAWWIVSGNIPHGAVFNHAGSLYYATEDVSIGGTPSDYVKLTLSGNNLTPSYSANLSGVSWNGAYNGYYDDPPGNLYVFDEYKAIVNGAIATARTKIGAQIRALFGYNNTFTGNNTLSGDNTFTGDNTLSGANDLSGSNNKINSYATNAGASDTLIKQVVGAGVSAVFDLKKPISAWLNYDRADLVIWQNSAWRPFVGNISGTGQSYATMMNPGRYQLRTNGSTGVSGNLYCSGVFGGNSIVLSEIVT